MDQDSLAARGWSKQPDTDERGRPRTRYQHRAGHIVTERPYPFRGVVAVYWSAERWDSGVMSGAGDRGAWVTTYHDTLGEAIRECESGGG